MTEPSPTAPDTNTASEPRRPVQLLKGCGCLGGLAALALGILVIGHFDSGAWASALGAIVIGVLVFAMSGTNGFWER
jgi:hypothetical protein